MLRLTISSNLRYNNHITESIKKANLWLFFLLLQIQAGVLSEDLNNFSCVAVWPVLQYGTRVFHHALPLYLSSETERAHKKAISINIPRSIVRVETRTFLLIHLMCQRYELYKSVFSTISQSTNELLSPPR